jgi:putative flippase GtrA
MTIKNHFWTSFRHKHPGTARFLLFFLFSNGVTLLQIVLMPLFKQVFGMTSLIDIDFQVGQIGSNFDQSPYYIFNYAAGALASGGGGGLAYFMAVQVTIAIAQIINFFAQRNVTFRSNTSIRRAALWYLAAYVMITIGAAALQGIYKARIYNLFINTWNLGGFGETSADIITVIINSAVSFWIFYPIMKLIFKQAPPASDSPDEVEGSRNEDS